MDIERFRRQLEAAKRESYGGDFSDDEVRFFKSILESENPLFITGPAGSGKSTLIRNLKTYTRNKRVLVVSPTALAAINVQGSTIHSAFRLPPSNRYPFNIYPENLTDGIGDIEMPGLNCMAGKADTIIIDEISMVRADLLDAIDRVLRDERDEFEPFGGVKMLFFGDLFQLPPIMDKTLAKDSDSANIYFKRYKTRYFLSSNALKETEMKILALSKVYRQSDQTFIEILNRIRKGEFSETDFKILNSRKTGERPTLENNIPLIASTKRVVENHNLKMLAQVDDEERVYLLQAYKYEENFAKEIPIFEVTKLNCPAVLELKLKRGARVIFNKNDLPPEPRWVNGTAGTISKLEENKIFIKLDKGAEVEVEREKWQKFRHVFNSSKNQFDAVIDMEFIQFPVMLGWAITIHKSQGMTFDELFVSPRRLFDTGHLYVALSRIKTLEGLHLSSEISFSDLSVDQVVVESLAWLEKNRRFHSK